MAQGRVYGHIPGIPVFTTFNNRNELLRAGVHAPSQAGIHGDPNPNGGAFSICISEGYEDNLDSGDKITYVGSGGQDSYGQVAHQSFDDPRNRSLQISCETKRPVRVVRGKNDTCFYSPARGYRYDGLYVVDRAEMKVGKKGYNMCFFELRRITEEGDRPIPTRRLLTQNRLSRMLRGARNR